MSITVYPHKSAFFSTSSLEFILENSFEFVLQFILDDDDDDDEDDDDDDDDGYDYDDEDKDDEKK